MKDRLAVIALGTAKAGKSTTWNYLFSITNSPVIVRTGQYERNLYLNLSDWIKVFLISGSPQERAIEIERLIPKTHPDILLCSIQYAHEAIDSFNHLLRNDYALFVLWINPGYSDESRYDDTEKIIEYLLANGATILQRNGKDQPNDRIQEIRQFLFGWGKTHNLLKSDFI